MTNPGDTGYIPDVETIFKSRSLGVTTMQETQPFIKSGLGETLTLPTQEEVNDPFYGKSFHSKVHHGFCTMCGAFDIKSPIVFLKSKNGKDIRCDLTNAITLTDVRFDQKRHHQHYCNASIKAKLEAQKKEEPSAVTPDDGNLEEYVKKFNEKYGIENAQ